MNRRSFLKRGSLGALGAGVAGLASLGTSTDDRPSVILVMSDDQGWMDVGYQGHPHLHTPHLDDMAASGLQFNRWYAAAPVCSPTRGSCLTGRHPRRYGIGGANDGCLPPQEVTLAELLRTQGYLTGHFGKWHLGTLTTTVKDSNRGGPSSEEIYSPPWHNGFEVCFSSESRMPTWDPMVSPSLEAGPLRRGQKPGHSFQSYYWTGPGRIATTNLEGDASRIVVDRVISFLHRAQREKRPFFAVVWLHAPHEPIVAGSDARGRYAHLSEDKQHYFGVITALDEQVGRIRNALRRFGVAENTMLWYCSDNGPAPQRVSPRCQGSTGPFRDRKGSLYEGGVRVPGIVEWPAMLKGGRSTNVAACTSDYVPTVLDALGLSTAGLVEPLDGMSLLPLINGRMDRRPKPIAFYHKNRLALNDHRYKILGWEGRDEYELYDLQEDPGETTDLASGQPRRVDSMREELMKWKASVERSQQGQDY